MFDSHVNLMPLIMLAITGFALPLATYLGHALIKVGERLAEPYIGAKTAVLFQQRADALLDKAIGAAVKQYLPELQSRGLTVDVGNQLIAWGADYAVNHAQDLAGQLNSWEGELQEKIGARLVTHPAVHAAVALPVAQAHAVPHAA